MTHDEIITGIPLTLEQLRKMDEKPVFCVSLNGMPGEWCIIRVVEMSETWFIACAGAAQGFGDKDTYGKTWLAYAYLPANLDRERFVPCDFCSKADFGDYSVEIAKSYATINCALGNYKYPEDKRFRYCPKCGRPLTPEAWETLEKRLKG